MYNFNTIAISYKLTEEIRNELKNFAVKRSQIAELTGRQRREFTDKYYERWENDYYGLLGEYATKLFFDENGVKYSTGKQLSFDRYDTTHDYIVKTKDYTYNVGVKTVVSKKYHDINGFLGKKFQKYTLFYPYRGKESSLKGHSYPDFLFFAFYFPLENINQIYLLGYFYQSDIINSEIIVYNKENHLKELQKLIEEHK